MNRPTLPFYLDENVSEHLVPVLWLLGYDALSTTQAGNKGATDPQQPLAATQMRCVLVTHNSADFRMLHEALQLWATLWGRSGAIRHAGILIITPEVGLKAPEMAEVVIELARREAGLTNRLFVWDRKRGLREDR